VRFLVEMTKAHANKTSRPEETRRRKDKSESSRTHVAGWHGRVGMSCREPGGSEREGIGRRKIGRAEVSAQTETTMDIRGDKVCRRQTKWPGKRAEEQKTEEGWAAAKPHKSRLALAVLVAFFRRLWFPGSAR
jgi:hypothetical protein